MNLALIILILCILSITSTVGLIITIVLANTSISKSKYYELNND